MVCSLQIGPASPFNWPVQPRCLVQASRTEPHDHGVGRGRWQGYSTRCQKHHYLFLNPIGHDMHVNLPQPCAYRDTEIIRVIMQGAESLKDAFCFLLNIVSF